MSGVLNRMVERALGTLLAAEPRIAPVAAAFSLPAADDWQGEVLVESEPRSDAPAARLRAQPDQLNETAPPLRRPVSPAERSTQIAPSAISRGERTGVASTADRAQAAAATRDMVRSAAETGDRDPAQPRQNDVIPEPPRQVARPESQAAAFRDSAVESVSHAPAPKLDEHPQTIHEHREITISIGRISMEAAPQPQARTPAAFRPRVTLDAFLQGRQEGRR